jgi:hypothetical protein
MATEGVEGCAHAQPEVAQYPHVGHFHRKLVTGNDVNFPRIFLSGSTKCWLGVFSATSSSTLVICPFYFHNYV